MKPYMISNTIKYSDGTETVVNYDANGIQIEETPVMETPAEEITESTEETKIEPLSESEVSDTPSIDETIE